MVFEALYKLGFRNLEFIGACRRDLYSIHYLYIIYFYFILMEFDWKKKTHLLGKLQDDNFLLENIYVIRRKIILELHQFDVLF